MPQERVVLAGPPGGVAGAVPFRNGGDEPVVLREVTIASPDAADPVVVSIGEVVVPPGERRDVGLELRLDAFMEPGQLPLELTLGDVRYDAVAHVVAVHQPVVTPDLLVLDLAAGTTDHEIVVANRGNVPVRLPAKLTVPVHREDATLTTVRLGLGIPGSDRQLDPVPEPSGVLEVSLAGGELAPGDVLPMTVGITVPDSLDPDRRHLAAIPVSIRTVLVVLVPVGAARTGRGTDGRAGGSSAAPKRATKRSSD